MKRRSVNGALAAGLVSGVAGAWPAGAHAQASAPSGAGGDKVLRYAFPIAETGFDPAQVSDLYSRIVTNHIFDAPLTYDHLARPFKLKPHLAEAMPEVSDDFRTFTFRIRRGVYFQDDPAFKGKKRELVAEDFVYAMKRIYDPKLKSPSQSSLEDEGIIGLRELREEALKTGRFDYDRTVEGLRAIDRHTLQVKLRESRPRHLYNWASGDIYGAQAREVVEFYGDRIMEHPVGTGPFRLGAWRRSSRIVLERNPTFRDVAWHAEPNADDLEGQAMVKRLSGRRLPLIDRVEISIIEAAQPRWLAFLNGEQDFMDRLPNEFIDQATPGGKIAPNLGKRGIRALRSVASDITLTVFNMENEVLGGYTPEKIALRRAICLGTDVQREIRLARRGQAMPANALPPPNTEGFRADLRTEQSVYDPARAQALLDVYSYRDTNGDGWRENPDGSPLVLVKNTQADAVSRQLDELWKKNMDALGLRATIKVAQWPENLKAARGGSFMIWGVGSLASSPDGQGALERVYGPSTGKGNLARIQLKAIDSLYEKMKFEPSGPSRQALFDRAAELVAAYAPYKLGVHRFNTDLAYRWLDGFRRPPFWNDWWHMVDIDVELKRKTLGA